MLLLVLENSACPQIEHEHEHEDEHEHDDEHDAETSESEACGQRDYRIDALGNSAERLRCPIQGVGSDEDENARA